MTAPLVAVLDYGAGNLRSVERALGVAGARSAIVSGGDAIAGADALIVPGVGRFGHCAAALRERFGAPLAGWIDAGRPVLGICVGMQILYATSEEDPEARGLGLIDGAVVRLPGDVVVPHMGWDVVRSRGRDPVLDVVDGRYLYFANSYCAEPSAADEVRAVCDYGPGFPCAVRTGNVLGTQFHPEKSGAVGAALLAAWITDVAGDPVPPTFSEAP